MRAMGASFKQLQQTRDGLLLAHASALFEVWPEHWHAVCVFCAMSSQWSVLLGMQGLHYQGLRYESLPIVLAAHKHNPQRQPLAALLDQLRCLERAAVELLNSKG